MDQKAVRHTITHVVPFYYDCAKTTFKDVVTAFNIQKASTSKGEINAWITRPPVERERMYHHIENLISDRDDLIESIGKQFILANEARVHFGLPRRPKSETKCDNCINLINKQNSYQFDIGEVSLYIFETGIGFLTYEISIPPVKIEDSVPIEEIISLNYYLKRISPTHGTTISFKRKISANQVVEEYIILADMISNMLAPCGQALFFENEGAVPNQSIVFSAVLLDKNPGPETNDLLMLLSRNFKDSYKAPQGFIHSENVYQPFEYSCWAFSLEGMANISWLIDDETTNTFLNTTFFSRLRNTYLSIYILALHQRYTLMSYAIKASQLPDVNKYNRHNFDSIIYSYEKNNCDNLRKNLIQFTLRSNFEQVIGITHINDVYRYMKRSLGIEHLINELSNELNVISERAKIISEKKSDRIVFRITIAGLIFALFQMLSSVWFIFTQFIWSSQSPPNIFSGLPTYFISFGGCTIILFFLLFVSFRKNKN